MFLLNSRLGLVTSTPSPYGPRGSSKKGAPLLPKLRGCFAEFLRGSYLVALAFSAQPPVSVCSTGAHAVKTLRSFSRQCGVGEFGRSLPVSPQARGWICLPVSQPFNLGAAPTAATPVPLRHSITLHARYRNLNRLSIGYGSRPRLRSRLTPGG